MTACKRETSASPQAENAAPARSLELIFTYGSEKEEWIKEATEAFNRAGNKTGSGQRIFVRAIAGGSGEWVDDVLNGHTKAHLISSASEAFFTLGNAQSKAKPVMS